MQAPGAPIIKFLRNTTGSHQERHSLELNHLFANPGFSRHWSWDLGQVIFPSPL